MPFEWQVVRGRMLDYLQNVEAVEPSKLEDHLQLIPEAGRVEQLIW